MLLGELYATLLLITSSLKYSSYNSFKFRFSFFFFWFWFWFFCLWNFRNFFSFPLKRGLRSRFWFFNSLNFFSYLYFLHLLWFFYNLIENERNVRGFFLNFVGLAASPGHPSFMFWSFINCNFTN